MSHSTLFQVMFILQNAGMKAQAVARPLAEGGGGGRGHVDLRPDAEYDRADGRARDVGRVQHRHFRPGNHAAAARSSRDAADRRCGPARHARWRMLPLLERRTSAGGCSSSGTRRPATFAAGRRAARIHRSVRGAGRRRRPTTSRWSRRRSAGRGLAPRITYARAGPPREPVGARAAPNAASDPESIVAISAEKSIEMIVGLLGILKAGGAYLPIDPSYPAERIRHMLSDSGATVLAHPGAPAGRSFRSLDAETRRSQPVGLEHVICLDADWPAIADEPATAPRSRGRPDNLAYVIYTSGSTGQSKGVLVEHRNLVNAYLAWEDAYELVSPGQDAPADGELLVRRLHRRSRARAVLGRDPRPRPARPAAAAGRARTR